MSHIVIEAGTPRAATPRRNRLPAALGLAVIIAAVAVAAPSRGMAASFIDQSVPQIVVINGP